MASAVNENNMEEAIKELLKLSDPVDIKIV